MVMVIMIIMMMMAMMAWGRHDEDETWFEVRWTGVRQPVEERPGDGCNDDNDYHDDYNMTTMIIVMIFIDYNDQMIIMIIK